MFYFGENRPGLSLPDPDRENPPAGNILQENHRMPIGGIDPQVFNPNLDQFFRMAIPAMSAS